MNKWLKILLIIIGVALVLWFVLYLVNKLAKPAPTEADTAAETNTYDFEHAAIDAEGIKAAGGRCSNFSWTSCAGDIRRILEKRTPSQRQMIGQAFKDMYGINLLDFIHDLPISSADRYILNQLL